MMAFESNILIARPTEDVFGFLVDVANDPTWRAGVVSMRADGPVVPGTTTLEELTFLGSTYVTRGVVTERSESRLAFRGESDAVRSDGFREAIPERGGTRVTYVLRLAPSGALRLFAPLLRPIYARRIAGDLVRLKAILDPR
jgi:carbon monoxide dehydrogenase subunit G